MKNLDEILLEEAKKAITELNKDHAQISTIKIIEKITGLPYSLSYSTNNIGLAGFLSAHQKELGIEFLNYEHVTINNHKTSTVIWRLM
ncbi:hypothetical protein CPJCM30710_12120 [Clostridium polyendosporum]|uniref:Uncharacterized protein n=1 Tax=Clostridium polyendosporum TaxID=69208 RepID=A0A919VGE5_9CLOT|nr:hypothetical protein [Clostridium polyendosporum]GIM28546.1 hypothetical protein CPJCM30710_12120 [Clostridium polyendosporum]